ncbi:MAG: hypothetical protein ABSA12_11840 [Verrucomicrobiia bacterium]
MVLYASIVSFVSMLSFIPWWGWLDVVFTLSVLIGVSLEVEWIQKRLTPERSSDLLPVSLRGTKLKKRGEVLLILGLAGELACLPIGLWETSKVSERVEGLRKANDELRANQKPRRITDKQIRDFIFLTEKVPKIPIRVRLGLMDWETHSYATRFREMLDRARFLRPHNADRRGFEYHPDQTIVENQEEAERLGPEVKPPCLCFYVGSTNENEGVDLVSYETVNGVRRPVLCDKPTTAAVYYAIITSLNDVGINAVAFFSTNRDYVETGDVVIFVPEKF